MKSVDVECNFRIFHATSICFFSRFSIYLVKKSRVKGVRLKRPSFNNIHGVSNSLLGRNGIINDI